MPFVRPVVQRFEAVQRGLTALGIPFRLNPRLVRGLDYYGHTAFEITSDQLGAQATVCGGGRYDGLDRQLGGTGNPRHRLGPWHGTAVAGAGGSGQGGSRVVPRQFGGRSP